MHVGENVRQQNVDSAKRWCDAWNAGGLDAIITHYADDVAFNSPTVVSRWGLANGWLHGKEKLREHFRIGLRATGLHFELIDVLHGMNSYSIVYRRETGALVTDTVELNDDGQACRVMVCYGQAPVRQADDLRV